MSRKLITAFLVFWMSSVSFAQNTTPLEKMERSLRQMMIEISQPGASNIYKKQRIEQFNKIIGETLNAAINDSTIPFDDVEKGFLSHDVIVNLSQLQLDANARFSQNSCAEARGMVRLGGGLSESNSGSDLPMATLQTINALCQ